MIRMIVVFIVLLALIAPVSAQDPSPADYKIRINRPMNLREEASIYSAIVASVPAGTELAVIAETDIGWLLVMHEDLEAWMADWLGHTKLSTPIDSPFDTNPLTIAPSPSMQATLDQWNDLIRYVDSRVIEQSDNCITANLASPYQDDDFFVCVLYEYLTDRTVLYTGLIYTHTFDFAAFAVQRDGQTIRFAPLGRGDLFLAIIPLDEPADYEIAVRGYNDAGAKTAAVRFSWPLEITNPYETDL